MSKVAHKRRHLRPKVRFDVFRRDGFTCGYCGNRPPAVVLEVDHVVPVSAGGDNSPGNLKTACFDCNRGKAANALSPITANDAIRLLLEQENQITEYRSALSARRERERRDHDYLQMIWKDLFGLSLSAWDGTELGEWLFVLPTDEVEDQMRWANELHEESWSPGNGIKYSQDFSQASKVWSTLRGACGALIDCQQEGRR